MGGEELKRFLEQARKDIQDQQSRFNRELEHAAKWLGVIPSLPSNETRQVVEHSLKIYEALGFGNPDAVILEIARTCKHIALGTHDCVETLIGFHFGTLEKFIDYLADRTTEVLTATRDALNGHKLSWQALEPPPSDQKESLEATNEDINKIERIIIEQIQLCRELQKLYGRLGALFGSDTVRLLLEQRRQELK